MAGLIGYSLSLCVRDIILDKVSLENVKKIVTNTCAYNEARWDILMSQYCSTYWRSNPQRAKEIVAYLRSENLIEQPRVDNPDYTHFAPNRWEAVDEN